ncbi:MAG: hypothetical protein ACM3L8_05610 [Verrucomicrobiota bacterium]
MSEAGERKTEVEVTCPCCGAQLRIDAVRGALLEARKPESASRMAAELSDASKLLAEESSRVEEKYRQIVAADKGRGEAMDKLFRNFMDKAKDEPAGKPVRDIDLD